MSQNIISPTAIALQHLGHGLINQHSRQNILAIIEQLPTVNEGFFECHFEGDGKVDFAVPVSVDEKETIQSIMSLQQSNAAPKLLGENSHVNNKNVENLWFEFDTSDAGFNNVPGIFFDTHRLHYQQVNDAAGDTAFWADRLNNIIPAIGTKKLTPENLAAIQQAINLLPGGYPAHIGVMKSRNEDLRLCVKFTDTEKLIDYIKSAGMELSDDAEEKLATLGNISDIVTVDFDFEDGKILPRFGVELFISKNTDLAEHQQYFMSHLQQYGLCTATQAEYILNWPQAEANEFIHRISHFKVVIDHGNITVAKAYLQYIYANN